MKNNPIDFTPYQDGLSDADQRRLDALIEAGYQLYQAHMISQHSGQFWIARRGMKRRAG